jgi:hypothetical protein
MLSNISYLIMKPVVFITPSPGPFPLIFPNGYPLTNSFLTVKAIATLISYLKYNLAKSIF